jgi:hypothetical protein
MKKILDAITTSLVVMFMAAPVLAKDSQFSEIYSILEEQQSIEEAQRDFCGLDYLDEVERSCADAYSAYIAANVEIEETIITAMRPAVVEDYREWLKGNLESGGEVSHLYNYEWRDTNWYVATSDFKLPKLNSARAVNVIVPEGIHFDGSGSSIGRSNVYLMDGHRSFGGWIPLYKGL